jgi:hypothetical protein
VCKTGMESSWYQAVAWDGVRRDRGVGGREALVEVWVAHIDVVRRAREPVSCDRSKEIVIYLDLGRERDARGVGLNRGRSRCVCTSAKCHRSHSKPHMSLLIPIPIPAQPHRLQHPPSVPTLRRAPAPGHDLVRQTPADDTPVPAFCARDHGNARSVSRRGMVLHDRRTEGRGTSARAAIEPVHVDALVVGMALEAGVNDTAHDTDAR